MKNCTAFPCLVLSFFLGLTILSLPTRASHLLGGELTFHADTTNTSSLRYFFKLVLYQDQDGSTVDTYQAKLDFGDGTTQEQERESQIILKSNKDITRNVFYFQHDYAAPGSFIVSFQDANRGSNFLNFASLGGITFFIQATVTIGMGSIANHSPVFIAPFISKASIGQIYHHNITAYDPDGDSLAYKLVPILQGAGQAATSYQFPDTTTIDNRTGEIVWNQPDKLGRYAFAVEVREYRQKQLIGKVMRDFTVMTSTAASELLMQVQNRDQIPINNRNQLFTSPNTPLKIRVVATNAAAVEAYSELFYRSKNITTQTAIDRDKRVYEFTINPEASLQRSLPYILTIRGTAADGNTQHDITLALYFRPQRASDQQDTTEPGEEPQPDEEPEPDPNGEEEPWTYRLYPNPVDTYFKVDNRDSIPVNLLLYSASGQLVLVKPLESKQTVIQRSSRLNAGMYFYIILSEQDKVKQTGKLVLF